jgi:hypothetical protein
VTNSYEGFVLSSSSCRINCNHKDDLALAYNTLHLSTQLDQEVSSTFTANRNASGN